MEFNHGHSFGVFMGRCNAVRASVRLRIAAYLYLEFGGLDLIIADMGRRGVGAIRGVPRARQDIGVSGQIDELVTKMADQAIRHCPVSARPASLPREHILIPRRVTISI
jgi:hypothetical protein